MTESIELIQLLSKSYFNWINSFAFRLFLLWVPFVSHFGSFHFFDFEDLRKTLNSTKTTPYRHCNFKTKHHVWPPDKIGLLLQYLWITNFCITKLHFLNVQRFFLGSVDQVLSTVWVTSVQKLFGIICIQSYSIFHNQPASD